MAKAPRTRHRKPRAAQEADFAPPEMDQATGIALLGGYPVNRRLRAEALFQAGKSTDEMGEVTDDAIAEAGERLAGDEATAKLLEEQRLDAENDAGVDDTPAPTDNPQNTEGQG